MADAYDKTPSTTESHLKSDGAWLITLGVLLLLLGIGAWFVPYATTMAVTVVLGVILIVGGIFQGIHAFFAGRFGTFLWQFLLGIVYVIAGILLVNSPVAGSVFLTIVLAAFLLVAGIIKLVQGIANPVMMDRGWTITTGIISILLAVLIMSALPNGAMWVIGVVVGVELIVAGLTAIMNGVALRRLAETPTPEAA